MEGLCGSWTRPEEMLQMICAPKSLGCAAVPEEQVLESGYQSLERMNRGTLL